MSTYQSNDEKTEKPTHYRLKKVYKKGEFNKNSRDVNSIVILIVFLLGFKFLYFTIFSKFQNVMKVCFLFCGNFRSEHFDNKISLILNDFFKILFFYFLLFFFSLLAILIFNYLMLNGRFIRFNFLRIRFSRINILKGIKSIFSYNAVLDFLKLTTKVFFLILFFILFIRNYSLNSLGFLYSIDRMKTFFLLGKNVIYFCCFYSILFIFPVVCFDILLDNYRYYKNLRMSRQEIRDEFKYIEGNPIIKFRIRNAMRISSKRNMTINVPKANVIITNPVNYAIALIYDEKTMHAPKVLVKGTGVIALKICSLGKKNHIPIMSNPILARVLYRYVEVGHYVPSKFYTVVAEVLAWAWRVQRWKRNGGKFPQKPTSFSILDEKKYKREKNV
ncbi:Flagellar biosynthetic protein FlhB [Buchnera aphidicola (Tetraneura ulmi)]|uniref:EscU/YscU/HrcU family type III secretion system export apparatus switch protein n=1 Tax=Buchnera aphidicola TaxID=9 RepID=UPI003464DE51